MFGGGSPVPAPHETFRPALTKAASCAACENEQADNKNADPSNTTFTQRVYGIKGVWLVFIEVILLSLFSGSLV